MNFDVTVTDSVGGTCVQEVGLTVITNCPDWDTLDWGHPLVQIVSAGTPVLLTVPLNGPSSSFLAQVFYADDNVDQFTTSNTGQLMVPGTLCHCNLHLVLTRTGIHNKSSGNVVMFGLTTFPIWSFTPFTPDGAYDVAFDLSDNAGVPNLVKLRFTISDGWFTTPPPPDNPTTTLTGLVTNV